ARMLSTADLHQLRVQLIADAAAALVALVVATTLSVYKPWGMTGYGRRSEVALNAQGPARVNLSWKALWIAALIVAIVLFVVLHLTGGGFGHH
ncbi:MAG TPA: hypothetical protein VFP91_14280, partial [Vicinamibacterales bacterium]|nr:hypothetical protein [Vicinamibacterales bacterium]